MINSNNVIYAIQPNGDLMWYRHDGRGDGSFRWASNEGKKVGTGWDGAATVFSGGDGIIYAIQPLHIDIQTGQRSGGDLMWYRHDGRDDGSFRWASNEGKKVGTGWGGASKVFSGGDGVIYAIQENGDLMWYRHDGRGDGSFRWASNEGKKVGTGWDGAATVFSGGDGIIYAIQPLHIDIRTGQRSGGDLMWYRHDGRDDGSFRWASNEGKKVGTGWGGASKVFSGGNGVIYAIQENGDLMWYRHDGCDDGSFRWASNEGKKVGTGWGHALKVFSGEDHPRATGKLQFRLLGFDELDSTDSFLQGASDEVYMSAIGTDSTAVHVGSDGQPTVDLVNANIVGDVSEDSVRGPWRLNPYVLLEFDLHRTGDWPRSYTATLLIVEKDNQDLANSFSELYEKIGGKIKEAVVSEATTVGAMVGTAIYPGIGTAVGAAIGALAGFGYDAIMPLIREGLGNDVFTPKSITLDIPGPRLIQNLPDVDQPKVVRIEELGAKYDIHYDWHFVDD